MGNPGTLLSQRQLRALLMLFMLFAALIVVQVASAPPASAAAYGMRTKLISRFNNGDVAYVQVSVERIVTVNNKLGRAHAKVWCENSNGQTVVCEEVEIGALKLQYWSGGWQTWDQVFPGRYAEVYPALDVYTPWECDPARVAQWRTLADNVKVQARSGQPGTFHDVPSNTTPTLSIGCTI